MEDPHPLIDRLMQRLHYSIKQYGGTEKLFFHDIVFRFYSENPELIYETMNEWWNGTILHGLVIYIMAPHLLWLPKLGKAQQREAIAVIFKLMSTFEIEEVGDHLGDTPWLSYIALAGYANADAYSDDETRTMLNNVLLNWRDIKYRMLFLIKRHLLHRKRRIAAKLICNRALEYVLNPDTIVGHRMLMRRAEQFALVAAN